VQISFDVPPMDEHMLALGQVTAAAGDLELAAFALFRMIHGGGEEVVRVITEGLSFDRMTELTVKLAKVVLPASTELHDQLAEWRAASKEAMKDRNAMSHAAWKLAHVAGLDGGDDVARSVIARFRQRTVAVAELTSLAADLDRVTGRALSLMMIAFAELSAVRSGSS
jgi:hypothetical protein